MDEIKEKKTRKVSVLLEKGFAYWFEKWKAPSSKYVSKGKIGQIKTPFF